jgi:hypothetical protein
LTGSSYSFISFFFVLVIRRGDRVADRAALEMLCTARYRGFESRPLRHSLN